MKAKKKETRAVDLMGHVIETRSEYVFHDHRLTMSIMWMDGTISENIPQPFPVKPGEQIIMPFRKYPPL